MPLLKNGAVVDDVWAFVEDGHELSPGGCFTVSMSRFLSEHDVLLGRNEAIGVRLQPSDDPALLADHLDRLHLIEVAFPKYTDGRGYSIANLLRRQLGYSGELRAVGQVLRDQLNFMVRTGFDAVLLDGDDAEDAYRDATAYFSEVYQASADQRETVFDKRHKKKTSQKVA